MRYICTSDIHLGHKKTPTKHIIESFTKCILTPANASIDALFVAGDFFDHLLYLNTQEAQQIVQFFHRLLSYCYDNNISLKVLEGTPMHDWHQSSMLVKINDVRTNKADLTYVKTLDIIHCPRLNRHILYIPDCWCGDQQTLERDINKRLGELGIAKVDIAVLHGAFRYQAKGIPSSEFLYDEDYFLNLTRGFIHIGHYHTHTHLDRIVAQGSLERLAHNEEGPKGYVVVQDEAFTFVENPYAKIYKTIAIGPSTDLKRLDKVVFKYPHGSHIRFKMKADHPFNANFKELVLRYCDYHLKNERTVDAAPDADSATYIQHDDPLTSMGHTPLEANVYDTVMRSVEAKHKFTTSELLKLHHYAKVLEKCDQPIEDVS